MTRGTAALVGSSVLLCTASDVRTRSYEVTIDDPGAYTKPWTGRWTISATSKSSWMPGGEMFEYICQGD